ncbi:rhomboid family intramembrane serine protease [Oceanobacillus piezotolerans]|uniref:Rhomboid family intramembrane serine protease n=1 Tax=Oceanobacillus piezotolerans TaxID=2448030 RepID=A0A498DEW7_9BACI|nr:rhomboid family intramembrane serine protease [Oceanobacillus piezotolerans]RLL48075.1 rhomboid family intramembrane serine protease [Oceanobacillus piezotolerans]
MYVNEQYYLYKIAYQLVTEMEFDILHIDSNNHEIWLEKYEDKLSKVVRLIHKGFDWKNHLKKDVAIVFQKTRNLKRFIRGKEIELHNIYVSTYPPVDDWELLKRPMKLKDKAKINMRVYYFDSNSNHEELERFQQQAGVKINLDGIALSTYEQEKVTGDYKQFLIEKLTYRRNEVENIFTFGKPFFTYLIIALNIFMFIWLEVSGGSTQIDTLIDLGAKYNPGMIENNEWWRIITSMFLHIGILHLLMNLIAVYYLGTAVERIFGKWRFLIIYLLAGIGGGLASFAFSTNISAGASGAIFGLFGALLFFGTVYKQVFLQTIGTNIIAILAINLLLGFMVEQIDMAAHIGGLIAGFIASAIVNVPKKKQMKSRIIASIGYPLMLITLFLIGYYNNLHNQTYHLMKIEELLLANNYTEVVEAATDGLELEGDDEAILLFQRSYAYLKLGNIEKAITDLEESTTYNNAPSEAYFNLALLYYNQGNIDRAAEYIAEAYKKDRSNPDYQKLYEEITGKSVDK